MQPGPYGATSPPATAPTPPPSERLTPSGWWYVVAATFGIGGIVLAILLGIGFAEDYTDRIDDFERVQVPGTQMVVLEAGDYTIYQEFFGADDDLRIQPDVTVNMTGPDGEAVELDEYDGSFSYAGSGREGVALSTFEAEERGEYTVSTEGDSLSTVAIGEGIGMQLFVGITLALATGFGGVVVCAVIAIVVAVKRSGAKTRRQLAMVQQGGWRPPPGASGWPGAPGWPQQPYGQPPYGYQQPPSSAGQPPYGYQQPPSGGYQPPPGSQQPPSSVGQPPYGYQQSPSGGDQPPPGNQQPTSSGDQPASGYQQPSSSGDQQPPYGYQQSPPSGGQPPSSGDQPPPGAYGAPPAAPTPAEPSPSSTPPAEHEGYQPSAPTRSMPPAPDDDQPSGDKPSGDPPAPMS